MARRIEDGLTNAQRFRVARPERSALACATWRDRHPETVRVAALKFNNGLTPAQYNALVAEQGGLCAICRQPERWLRRDGSPRNLAVDHDHACCPGKRPCGDCIRGLLCADCNVGLSNFRDDIELLQSAARYLSRGGG